MKRFLKIISSVIVLFSCVCIFCFVSSAVEKETDIYSYCLENVLDFKEEIDISDFAKDNKWKFDDVKNFVTEFCSNEPYLFFVDINNIPVYYNDYSCDYILKFKYRYSKSKVSSMMKKLNDKADEIVKGMPDGLSDVEKALYIHDYIIVNTKYDHSLKDKSAYTCLVENSSTCLGYSLAYVYLMKYKLGIDCSVVVSDEQEHAWNYIKLDGKWYHADLTADDLTFSDIDGKPYDGYGMVSHKNFLLSDKACKKSSGLHRNWETFSRPAATSAKYNNYFWKNSDSSVVWYNGLCYYSELDSSSPGLNYSKSKKSDIITNIKSFDFKTKKTEVIDTVSSTWLLYRNPKTGDKLEKKSWYKKSNVTLAVFGNKLYYNTTDKLRCINLDSGKVKKVYTLKIKDNSIYSIVKISDSKIRINYKKDISYKGKYKTLNIG